MDNKHIKDGLGSLFYLRSKDVSSVLDGSIQQSLFYATLYPPDYGGGGMFQHCAKSGVLNAGLPAAASIYSFFWPSTSMLAVIQRLRLSAWAVTAFSGGGLATFDLFAARPYTSPDTGGIGADLTGTHNTLRTRMASSEAEVMGCNTLALAVGTRTLDPSPIDSRTVAVPAAANTPFSNAPVMLFEKLQGEHPLILATNEGLIVEVTLPNTGTWQYSLTLEWGEIPIYPY